MGLGLTIAHGIATSHKGTLRLESVANRGSTVTLRLPIPEKKRLSSARAAVACGLISAPAGCWDWAVGRGASASDQNRAQLGRVVTRG